MGAPDRASFDLIPHPLFLYSSAVWNKGENTYVVPKSFSPPLASLAPTCEPKDMVISPPRPTPSEPHSRDVDACVMPVDLEVSTESDEEAFVDAADTPTPSAKLSRRLPSEFHPDLRPRASMGSIDRPAVIRAQEEAEGTVRRVLRDVTNLRRQHTRDQNKLLAEFSDLRQQFETAQQQLRSLQRVVVEPLQKELINAEVRAENYSAAAIELTQRLNYEQARNGPGRRPSRLGPGLNTSQTNTLGPIATLENTVAGLRQEVAKSKTVFRKLEAKQSSGAAAGGEASP